MSSAPLFSEFDPVSSKAFKQKIQYDLKGADYNDTLVWHSDEGIDVKPFYHRDELKKEYPIIQMPEQWYIGEAIYILSASQSAQTANKAITDGAEALYFTAQRPFDIPALFDNLDQKDIPLYIKLGFLDAAFYKEIYAYAKTFPIHIKLDLIHHLTSDGNWFHNLEKDHKHFAEIISNSQTSFSVDTTLYQNAGATMVQQLAYGLAHLNEYLNHCEQEKLLVETIIFEVAVGTNYFFEIAKLRSVRLLVSTLLNGYVDSEGHKIFPKANLKIIAQPTRRNKTIYDYNTNMLRTTTECMSAILGGADWVVNLPYDALYHKTNDFGQRISRNQLIVLKEESYFNAVSNPADGSYYIEELTKQLSEKALALFKDIEKNGGFLKQLKAGTIQRKVKESATREQQHFNDGSITLLGTNKHPNPDDRMKNSLELYPFVKIKPRKTIIEPLIPRRLAEALEQDRLKKES